jgi:hypothetical protein
MNNVKYQGNSFISDTINIVTVPLENGSSCILVEWVGDPADNYLKIKTAIEDAMGHATYKEELRSLHPAIQEKFLKNERVD